MSIAGTPTTGESHPHSAEHLPLRRNCPTDEDIVISGISGRYPESDSLDEFWDKLLSGVELISCNDLRWPIGHMGLPHYTGKVRNVEKLDNEFFKISESDANLMDPQLRILHEVTYETILDAGINPVDMRGSNTAVYIGLCYDDSEVAQREDESRAVAFKPLSASRLSYAYDFKGPCFSTDTACASSFSAFFKAMAAIRVGHVDAAIVAGVAIHLRPSIAAAFHNLQMLSDDGRSKCMDAKADGYCRSEAVVSVLLQRKSVAKRIYATVLNARTNNDGYKPEGITFPSMAAQRKLMKETYAEAGVDPLDIKYMEAHMTGTPAGDPVESQAIVEALCMNRKDPLLMGCLKSNMGHTEGASGMCAISKACLVFQRREIPPNLHLVTPNPNIEGLKTGVLKPVLERTEFNGDMIGVNSFGFGGCNVHAVLKANEKVETEASFDVSPDIPRIINYAGRTNEAVNSLFDHLDSHPKKVTREFLAIINEASKINPEQGLIHRGYVILDAKKKGIKRKVTQIQEKRPIWFVFSSLGTSWPRCAAGLMTIPVFEESIKQSGLYLFPYGIDLLDLVIDPNRQVTSFTESLLVTVGVEIALIDLLRFLKVTPDGILGHSLGEVAAAYAAGSLTVEEALHVAYHIGQTVEDFHKDRPRSTMGLVGLGQQQVQKRLPPSIDIACVNSDSVTVAGPVNEVRKFLDDLESEGILAREIESNGIPLHSKSLHGVEESLMKALSSVLKQNRVRPSKWLSATSMDESWEEQAARLLTPGYFVKNVTSQVALSNVLDHIPKNSILVEIAPSSVLLPSLRRGLGADVICTSLMKRDSIDNLSLLLSGLGDIYCSGNNVAIDKLYPKVEWPVPRETASLSSLIKWNHSKDWNVPSYPDHFNLLKGNQGFSIDVMEVRYQYLTGHCIDGRVLFPATGYLWIIWERAAVLSGYNGFADVSVEFRDVKLYRATMLAKTGLTSFKLVVIPETGQFAVVEGGTICVTGHVKLLKTPEDEDTTEYERMVQPPFNPDAIKLQTKEIYKEFRVRGYDYGPTFQGLVEASSDATSAKVKWVGNWVSFTDSMLQLAILGQKKRGLLLPTFIELVKCDIKSLYTEIKRNKNNLGESEVDVFYDKDINIGVSRGIVVKGLKASAAPRRQGAQTATVETYGFLPYNETTFISDSDVKKMEEYTQMCRHLIRKVLDPNYALPDPSDTMKIYLESSDRKFTLLKLLNETLNDQVDSRPATATATATHDTRPALDRLQEKLSRNQSNLSQDIIVSLPITNEKLIRPHIDVILENTSSKKLTVTEANTTSALMHSFITDLMAANGVSLSYSFLHPVPDQISKQIGGLQVSSLFSTFPTNIQPDLIVYKDSTTSFLTDSDIPEVNEFELQAFLKSTLTSLKEGGFMLLLNRYCISPIEQKLLDVQGLNWPKLRDFDAIKAYAEEIGFVTISEKFDGVSCQSLLLRKPCSRIDEELIVIPVEMKQYNWVTDLKTHLLDKSGEKANKRVWLVANDSPNNGIVGLVNCLRKEVGGDRVRCLFCPPGEGKPGEGKPEDNLTPELLKKDLVMNIYRNGAYGSFRHFLLDSVEEWAETEHAYLDMKTKGDLSSMRWVEGDHKFWPTLPASAKSPKQILCSTYYSALNFKDVMVATGRIPVDAYPVDYMGTGLIGMEFTGRDQFGNRVMAFTGSKAIASTILLPDPYFIWKIPDMWSMAEACTIPVVYVTVYYALLIRGNLRHGESVLIHAGSGGVGQAAISVCLSMGCNVFTTVGSAAKREFLKKEFPQLEDSHIGNSRDCSFEDMVMLQTDGRGVDIVLNSLADEKFKASVRCLADFGRFVEIGKYDIVQNNPINLSDLGRNKTYHAVCVAHLDYDAIINKSSSALNMGLRVRKMVSDGIESGAVRPLKYHVFEKDQAEEAFRFMATGKHMGKVLIKIREEEPNHVKCLPKPITIKALKQTTFHPLKSYLITGGLGGFGLELADWMITNGARKIVLSSRSGLKTPFQHLAIRRMKSAGAQIVVSNSDVSTFAGAATLVQEAENLGTVGGIFHLAMVLKDSILENQTVESFEQACASKVQGTLNLDKITRTTCPELEYFVCFSSVVSGRGNGGQTNYGFANSVMERTCEVRRKDGLPGLAIQWGAIGDVGVVAESMGGNDVVIGGTLPQRIPSCMDVLNQFMQSVHTVCSSIVKADNKRALGGGKGDLVRTVCHILGVKDPSSLDPNTSLGDLGLDSLMAVEIRQGLERDFDIVLSTQEVRALKIKDIQVIGSKTFQQKKSKEKNEVKIDESKFSFELPAEMFVRLNSGDHSGRPIFLIPPIEGDFKTLAPIIGHIDRPIIGLNWTVDLDKCETIPEVATHYVQFLRETYPDGQYDLVGYSYGSLIAFEICLQLQELMGEKSVKKLLLLDGSPSYLKAFTVEMGSKNNVTEETEAHVEMLLGFAAMVHPLETTVQRTLKDALLRLPTKDERTKSVAEYISNLAGVTIDPHVLTSNAERYFKKVKMVHFYEPSDKYSGEIKLVRATETGYSNALTVEIEADYGLNKICSGNIEVIALDGDHKTFIANHSEEIGTIVDSHFQYFAFA